MEEGSLAGWSQPGNVFSKIFFSRFHRRKRLALRLWDPRTPITGKKIAGVSAVLVFGAVAGRSLLSDRSVQNLPRNSNLNVRFFFDVCCYRHSALPPGPTTINLEPFSIWWGKMSKFDPRGVRKEFLTTPSPGSCSGRGHPAPPIGLRIDPDHSSNGRGSDSA